MRIILLLLLAVLLALVGCSKPDSEATLAYKQAQTLRDQEKYQDAIRLYRRAIELDPAFDKSYLDLAQTFEGLGDNQNAAEMYRKFIEVTQNAQMREKARSFLAEVQAAVDEAARDQQAGSVAQLSPQMKQLVDQAVAKERDRLQKEFSAKQAGATGGAKSDDALRAELIKTTTANEELESKLAILKSERDQIRKTSEELRGKADVAELLQSPRFKGNDKELMQNLVRAQTELDQVRAQMAQQGQQHQKDAGETVKLKQQLIELQRGGTSGSTELQRKISDLETQNRTLAQQVSLLQSAGAPAAAAGGTANPAALQRLQLQIAQLTQEKQQAVTAQQNAETLLASLKRQTDDILAAMRTDASRDPLSDNRRLRLQIAKMVSQNNELAGKQAVTEQRAQALEAQVQKMQTLPQNAQDLAAPEFSDLSDEIVKMQKTIEAQRTLLAQRDAQVASLAAQARTPEVSGTAATRPSALVDDLNAQLARQQEQIAQLTRDTADARAGAQTSAAAKRLNELQTARPTTPAVTRAADQFAPPISATASRTAGATTTAPVTPATPAHTTIVRTALPDRARRRHARRHCRTRLWRPRQMEGYLQLQSRPAPARQCLARRPSALHPAAVSLKSQI
ncbi:MAG: tetratricopeptide repeat protein [bacterium]|nr:tetratricopeptide repeat protein [bacterium]